MRQKTGPLGQPKGSFAHHPEEVDQIATGAMNGVTDGSIDDLESIVPNFARRFGGHINTAKEIPYEPMRGAQLKASSQAAKCSVAGLDNISPFICSLLSDLK